MHKPRWAACNNGSCLLAFKMFPSFGIMWHKRRKQILKLWIDFKTRHMNEDYSAFEGRKIEDLPGAATSRCAMENSSANPVMKKLCTARRAIFK